MKRSVYWLWEKLCSWLIRETPPASTTSCDFNRLNYELRPGDIVLVEGRSRVSEVIKLITQSAWTHSALFVGHLYEIEDQGLRNHVRNHYAGDPKEKLLIEAVLGEGTIVVPVTKYRHDHLRICGPGGLSPADARAVITFSINRLGSGYDVRQLLGLAQFFFPWSVLPRRWRSTLFQHNIVSPTRTVCSGLLAEAFSSVDFPILPFIERREDVSLRFFKRNPKLFTPKDFDHSPYFDIIKYPFLGLDDLGIYRNLPWAEEPLLYNDEAGKFDPEKSLNNLNNINNKQDIMKTNKNILEAWSEAKRREDEERRERLYSDSGGPLQRWLQKYGLDCSFLLQERLKSLGKASEATLQHVHVIGGGSLGGDIAAWCALKGLRVTLQDRGPEHLARAIKRAQGLFRRRLRQPRLVLVNRILLPYLLEAVRLLEEGVVAEQIDRAALDFGMPMGPIELADSVGLDICLSVAEKLGDFLHTTAPEILRTTVADGKLGR